MFSDKNGFGKNTLVNHKLFFVDLFREGIEVWQPCNRTEAEVSWERNASQNILSVEVIL